MPQGVPGDRSRKKSMPNSSKLARAVALMLVSAPGGAIAAQLNYVLYGGVEHSNNIALTATNPISENVLIPGMSFNFAQAGAALQANVAGNLEYRDYLGGRFANQTQTQLAGQANWTVLPGRLDLTAQDYAGIQPIDRLAANGPDNQQQTNVFTFGPTLHFRLGDAARGLAQVRYINSYAEKTKDFNSGRTQASLSAVKDLNPTDQLSLNIENERVSLSSHAASSDYSRNQLYGQYISKLARLRIDVTAGWSELDFKQPGAPTASGPLTRLTIDYTPTERSSFRISAAREYSDAAQDILLQQPASLTEGTGQGINIGNTTVDSQVYLERRVGLSYAFTGARFNFLIAPLYRKLGYLDDPISDQTTRSVAIDLGYRLRPTLTLSAFVTGERLAYDRLARHDTTTSLGLDLARQWTPHWGWHLSFRRQRRASDAPDQSFRENQIYLGFTYTR
jgi:hypothetical protein